MEKMSSEVVGALTFALLRNIKKGISVVNDFVNNASKSTSDSDDAKYIISRYNSEGKIEKCSVRSASEFAKVPLTLRPDGTVEERVDFEVSSNFSSYTP